MPRPAKEALTDELVNVGPHKAGLIREQGLVVVKACIDLVTFLVAIFWGLHDRQQFTLVHNMHMDFHTNLPAAA